MNNWPFPIKRNFNGQTEYSPFAISRYRSLHQSFRSFGSNQYIRNYYDGPRPGDLNCDGGLSKDYWLSNNWRNETCQNEQLYDLVFDPNETQNLTGDSSLNKVLTEMRGRLDRWMKKTGDPLLIGPVPAPPGARINDPADLPMDL